MSNIYNDEKYKNLISSYRPSIGGLSSNRHTPHHLAWNFPIIMVPRNQ
jgi:hypothetical protein